MNIKLYLEDNPNWVYSPKCRKVLSSYFSLESSQSLVQVVYDYIHGITKRPQCQYCIKESKFLSYKNGYSDICSVKGKHNPCSRRKAEETNISRFGSAHYVTAKGFKEKSSKTVQEKYGVDNVMQVKDIADKCSLWTKDETRINHMVAKQKKTNRIKYGTDWVKTSEFKQKSKKTLSKKYGVTHNSQIDSVKKSKVKKSTEKFGTCNISQSDAIKRKKEVTSIKNYGVPHAMQNSDYFEGHNKSAFARKHITHQGKLFTYQGWEDYVLLELFQTHDVNDIITDKTQMPPFFYLDAAGKRRRYYPDIYIKSQSAFIEVKSTYTRSIDKNLERKGASIRNAGYTWILYVVIKR